MTHCGETSGNTSIHNQKNHPLTARSSLLTCTFPLMLSHFFLGHLLFTLLTTSDIHSSFSSFPTSLWHPQLQPWHLHARLCSVLMKCDVHRRGIHKAFKKGVILFDSWALLAEECFPYLISNGKISSSTAQLSYMFSLKSYVTYDRPEYRQSPTVK